MTIMDENKTAEQRRLDLFERLRMRFNQYQKQHTDSSERYASNEFAKDEKERRENHMYQQRILSARAGTTKTVPKPRLDLSSTRTALNEAALNNNLGGEQAMILQQTLKRRFTESVNQSMSTAHSQQQDDNNPAKRQSVGHDVCLDGDDNNLHLVSKNDAGKPSTLTSGATTSGVDIAAMPEANGNSSFTTTANNKSANLPARTTAEALANTNLGNASTSESNGRASQAQAIVPEQSHNNYNSAANTAAEQLPANNAASSQPGKNYMSQNNDDPALKSEFPQISGESLEFNIKRDLADFEDVLRNISENGESVADNNHGGDEPKLNLKANKSNRDKPVSSTSNINGVHKHASGAGQGGMPHLSHFEGNTFTTSQPLMSHFSAAPNQTMHKAQQQQQQQSMPVSRSMVGGYPNLPAPSATPQGFIGRTGTRPNLGSAGNTKNPEIVEKLQQHLIQQQLRRKQQQAVASPVGMQAAMQHHQYRQSMMNYMQQTPKPRMPPMSPSMPQNYRQHPVASPVDQMQQNPFHFQPDYNMYLEQQKMMQSPDAMPMQSPTMNGPRMPPGYFPHGQDPNYGMVQSPIYPTTPQRAVAPSMFPTANTMRQHMMQPTASMNMMGGQGYQQGVYQQNAGIPQRLPPQYSDSAFHFNQMSMDNQVAAHSQAQAQMSSSRLSHYMTPDKEGTQSMHPEPVLKSPSHMVPPNYSTNVSMLQQQQRSKMYNGGMKPLELNDSLPKYPQTDYRTMQNKNNGMMRFNGQIPADSNPRSSVMGQYFSPDQMVPQTSSLETPMAQMHSTNAEVVDMKPKQELFSPMQSIEHDLTGSLTMRQAEPDIETLLRNPPQDFDLVKMLGH